MEQKLTVVMYLGARFLREFWVVVEGRLDVEELVRHGGRIFAGSV